MPFIIPANTLASGGFEVANSCRFNGTSSDYLSKTPSSSGNRKTWTASVWLKGQPSTTTNNIAGQAVYSAGDAATDRTHFYFTNGIFEFRTEISNTQQIITTNQVFTDVSAWYHFVVAVDSTQSTAANRVKIYVNGVQITSFAAAAYLAQDADTYVNHTVLQTVGRASYIANQASGSYWNGYMAEFVLLDGTAATPTSFAEFDEDSNIWKPIKVSGLTPGTNGFYLDFQASGNLGNDAFGGTDLDEYNLTAIDQSTDTCTNNFATIGTLFTPLLPPTYSEGNLQSYSTAAGFYPIPSSIGVANGKWYMELKYTATTANDNTGIGITMDPASGNQTNTDQGGYVFGYSAPDGNLFPYQGNPSGSFASYTVGDIMGIYMDLDNMKLYFSKNGALQSATGKTINVSNTGFYYFCVLDYTNTSNYWTWQWNFGAGCPFAISSGNTDANDYGNFEYSPTITGDGASKDFFALCTKNLAEYG